MLQALVAALALPHSRVAVLHFLPGNSVASKGEVAALARAIKNRGTTALAQACA